MKLNKSLILIVVPVLVCLAIGVYYVRLVFSESLRFPEKSIEYLLLTPSILKNLPVEKIGVVKHYYYSAADGNKPLINAIEMESKQDKVFIKTTVTSYLDNNGFTSNDSDSFLKDDQEITLTIMKSESDSWNVNVALVEMIK